MIENFQIWLSCQFGGLSRWKKRVINQITDVITISYKQIGKYDYTAKVAGYTISAKQYIHGWTRGEE